MEVAESISMWVGIVSLVVGFTSLFIAGFATWLSWQFYKESQSQSDRTQDAVVRIENVITSVNSSINQIVERAVSAWVGRATPTQEENIAADLVSSYNELIAKMDSLEKGKDSGLRAELVGLIEENQARTEVLFNSLRETRLRALFQTQEEDTREPAVSVSKTAKSVDDKAEHGEVSLTVHREAKVITGTAYLDCEVTPDGSMQVELISTPDGRDRPGVASGLGQGGRMHIHLNGRRGSLVSPGQYVVAYSFKAEAESRLPA